MFEKGLKAKIYAEPLEAEKSYLLLESLKEGKYKNHSTIIYGRNGSGKTTICNALSQIKLDESERYMTVTITDCEDYEYTDINDRLFVFGEKFTDEQIKFKSDGLDTIILLGENTNVDDKIEFNKNKLLEIEDELKKYDLSKYDDKKIH